MDDTTAQSSNKINLETSVREILKVIDQGRELDIVTRRFGLYGNRETLEQIGESLGVTRERVRQLEKAILNKIKLAISKGEVPAINQAEKIIIRHLAEMGRISCTSDLIKVLTGQERSLDYARLSFVATLAPNLTVIEQTDSYNHSIGIREHGDEKKIRAEVEELISIIKQKGEPMTIEELHSQLSYEHPDQVKALASISKIISNLGDKWGLAKWPSVNPRNIRDKIYVVLQNKTKPMHFSEIAKEIRTGNFKRKDVTVQAIHNELIKDPRFVLIGRGIYALSNWGFGNGTVADVIAKVLEQAGQPLHRDAIVKEVLKTRQVKEATVLLNLQNRPQFKRVAKATYTLDKQQ